MLNQIEQQVVRDLQRAGVTPDTLKAVQRYNDTERQIRLLGGIDRQKILNALEKYKMIVDRSAVAHSGGGSGPRTKIAISVDVSDGSTTGESAGGSSDSDSGDDDSGDGDGDSDGPRRHSSPPPSHLPAPNPCASSRVLSRNLNSKSNLLVTMHTRALIAFVLTFFLSICGALGFVMLGHEYLAVTCLGLTSLGEWALVSKLVSPK